MTRTLTLTIGPDAAVLSGAEETPAGVRPRLRARDVEQVAHLLAGEGEWTYERNGEGTLVWRRHDDTAELPGVA